MKRMMTLALAVLLLVLAFFLGAANAEPIMLNLVWVQLHWPLGVVLILALGLGMLVMALMLYLLQILPLQYRLRNCQRKLEHHSESHELSKL